MNRINLICLGVRDMASSLSFYRSIGFQTMEREAQPPIVFFDNEGSKLELFPLADLAKDINAVNPPERAGQSFPGITLACNFKDKAAVDNVFKLVKQNGGVIAKEPAMTDWGGYSGYFQDLDGYYWEAAYGPDWEFDEQNMLVIP